MDYKEEKYEDTGITFAELFLIIKKNIIWLIVSPIIVGSLFFIYGKVRVTPMYSATARLYVVSASDSIVDIGDLQLGASLTNDYMELIKGKPFIQEALEEVPNSENYSYTYSYMQKNVTISNPADSHILRITVTSPDPTFSADYANTLAEISVTKISEIMETSRPKVVEYAEPVYSKISPNLTVYTIIGALLGIIGCAVIILIIHLLDSGIKTEDDVEKYLGLDTIGFIADEVSKNKVNKGNEKNAKN